jgi:hypothetical protein
VKGPVNRRSGSNRAKSDCKLLRGRGESVSVSVSVLLILFPGGGLIAWRYEGRFQM